MTDRLDVPSSSDPFGAPLVLTGTAINFDGLRSYILENHSTIVTTVQVIDRDILALCHTIVGDKISYIDPHRTDIRRPIILIVDDEGHLVDIEGHHVIIARAAQNYRTVAVHRIRADFAYQHFSKVDDSLGDNAGLCD
ncbi:hypothetical protein [Thalassospira sp. CH_XMU1420-2]|uniref:hypothetical protein n=1 Tax=Thalassospira sp. CH_XMU1420-2 TaxID=3107769 RepID=UPI003009B10B|tara:strand:+ start:14894 stop:15307 length:414 start_codon:yes stop_codon:yes gene_type:complete